MSRSIDPGHLREEVVDIARGAIASIDLAARVRTAVVDVDDHVVVAAVGKAAPAMARAAIDVLKVERYVVVAPDGTDARGLDVLRASHPIPDERSVIAANALLDVARDANLLALISGGASALACLPVEGISLDEKRLIVRTLLESGAPIQEVNLVRRHLSRIKGGGLAAVARTTRALIVSDVLFGSASDVGSGPASQAPDDLEEARAAIGRYPSLARFADRMIASPRVNATSRLIASPDDLANAAAEHARARGYAVTILPASMEDADRVAAEYVAMELAPGSAIVRVAEPSVRLPASHGQGGRAGRVALCAWNSGVPDDVALACVASDGVDGSGDAGAVVSGGIDARDALFRYDDAPFLRAHGASIALGPTGQNLCDLHVMVRARS
jgi:glycerate 2-kinase